MDKWGPVAKGLSVFLVFVCLCLGSILIIEFNPGRPAKHPAEASSTVRVDLENGHGSGVLVTSGVILTAAHVVDDNKTVKVTTDKGEEVTAEVLWVSKERDLALLRPYTRLKAREAKLACRLPVIGEPITVYGSPLALGFSYSWGKVAGPIREFGEIKHVFLSDVTIAHGNSGGPVYDNDKNVLGIVVAIPTMSLGFTRAPTRWALVVPALTACQLMGRL